MPRPYSRWESDSSSRRKHIGNWVSANGPQNVRYEPTAGPGEKARRTFKGIPSNKAALLAKLEEPEPQLVPFDPSKAPPFEVRSRNPLCHRTSADGKLQLSRR